jgi:hypothetical protein
VKPQRSRTTPCAIFTLAPLLLLPIVAGCEDVALIGRPALDSRSRSDNIEFIGRIEDFDYNRQELYIRTEGGQSQIVTYTGGTQVIIDDKDSQASRLRRGDIIELRMHVTADGRALADSIRVRESGSARDTTIEGIVEQVLSDRGAIELRTASGGLATVYLPRSSPERTSEEFKRLRSGDFVRFEGVFLGENQIEITGVL